MFVIILTRIFIITFPILCMIDHIIDVHYGATSLTIYTSFFEMCLIITLRALTFFREVVETIQTIFFPNTVTILLFVGFNTFWMSLAIALLCGTIFG